MRRLAHLFLFLAAGLLAQPAMAQTLAYGDFAQLISFGDHANEGIRHWQVAKPRPALKWQAVVTYGPFRVVGETRAVMSGATDLRTIDAFQAMMRDYPRISTLEMASCPGTYNDQANMQLGRMIRARGISTYVPSGGFVASGAVEIYLAGVTRYAEPSARFAVHSWEDYSGRQPDDIAQDAPQNLAYLEYYRSMGMSDEHARAFYAMTNSVPFEQARWLTSSEMAQWASYDAPARPRGVFAQAARDDMPLRVASNTVALSLPVLRP